MGTYVNITVIGEEKHVAEEAVSNAFREMHRLISIFNRYDEFSQVGRLNRQGVLFNPAPELLEVLRKADYYWKVSNGAFDVTVAPVIDLIRESFSMDKEPTHLEISKVLSLVDFSKVRVGNGYISFALRDMKITLDGLAKGFIVDRAVEVLEGEGITCALVDAGGDIRALSDESKEWRIGIRDPSEKKGIIAKGLMRNGAIATSGDYEVYFDNDRLYTHLVNPKTGRSPRRLASVTVEADTCVDADAASTACFILGDKAPAMLEKTKLKGLIITREGEILSHSLSWM